MGSDKEELASGWRHQHSYILNFVVVVVVVPRWHHHLGLMALLKVLCITRKGLSKTHEVVWFQVLWQKTEEIFKVRTTSRIFDIFLIRWLPLYLTRLIGALGILNSAHYKQWVADIWASLWGSASCTWVRPWRLQLTRRERLPRYLSGLEVTSISISICLGKMSTSAFTFRRKVVHWFFKGNIYY